MHQASLRRAARAAHPGGGRQMPALLNWVSHRPSWQVFALGVVLALVPMPRDPASGHLALSLLAAAIGAALVWGYPLLLIFGIPSPFSTKRRREIALMGLAVLGLVVLLAAGGVATQFQRPEALRVVLGVPFAALLLAPSFIAACVVGDLRRALGQYRTLDHIGTWVCIFSYPVMGVFFIQRTVLEALDALAAQRARNGGAELAV